MQMAGMNFQTRSNIVTCSKGLAAYAAKTECTKLLWGSQLPQSNFVHFVCIALQCKPFEQI